ncbi:YopX family protein [Lacticaseibacillus paracasei]|uniref:YopX family protein n=1 Tax=Lacticaseibacillus paracasei TaxID=1597 RepID=UPI0021AF5CB2|nr:YopX family protein [Lacticaseibacillus paracasei]UWY23605.1 YopX family protein [Lacticaseibacillus paracasei]UWY24031.1 YopX family protein [Lacticaseibacillus paracasei]UWY25659.1 YopX family protein [Lacticaseibacillus paracasei]
MREIKFRGYDPDTKRWYYGSLVKQNKTTYVTSEDYDQNPSNTEWFILWDEMTDWCLPNRHIQGSVDPESIGEYTGLHDKNGREVYENDILKVTSEDGESYVAVVKWFGDEGYPAFDLAGIPAAWCYESNALATISESGVETCEVIGNIFENPELLEAQHE